ncbi:hypothetical protein QIG64_27525, partial [Klebsiella pneumoniae]|nr:hypothetical protein [Klebsiella pneumoniae]
LNNVIASEQTVKPIEPLIQSELRSSPKSETSQYKFEQNSFNYEDPDNFDLDDITTSLIKNGFNEREIGHYLIKLA